jgi:transposase InsO family protein
MSLGISYIARFSGTSRQSLTALPSSVQSLNDTTCITTSDNGGAYIGTEFRKILKSFDIQQWITKPYISQQNGKMERFWGTLDSELGD